MQHAEAVWLTGEAEDSLWPGVEGDADDEEDDQDEHHHADHGAGSQRLWNGGDRPFQTVDIVCTEGYLYDVVVSFSLHDYDSTEDFFFGSIMIRDSKFLITAQDG